MKYRVTALVNYREIDDSPFVVYFTNRCFRHCPKVLGTMVYTQTAAKYRFTERCRKKNAAQYCFHETGRQMYLYRGIIRLWMWFKHNDRGFAGDRITCLLLVEDTHHVSLSCKLEVWRLAICWNIFDSAEISEQPSQNDWAAKFYEIYAVPSVQIHTYF